MAWAQASPHQGAIVQLCLPEQPTWSIVRGLGLALWLRDVMGWKQAGSKGLMPKPYGALPSPPAHAPRIPRARA